MATNKPQFHCYIDARTDEEISEFSQRTGVPKGKLVERMWRVFNLRDLETLVDQLILGLQNDGLSNEDLQQLYRLYRQLNYLFKE